MQQMEMPMRPVMASRQPAQLRQAVSTWGLLLLVVALVGGSLVWMQWAAQRGLTLGYPTPSVHLHRQAGVQRINQQGQFWADGTGRNLTYLWDFGDQTGANGSSVTHVFGSNGSFTVTVTATDPLGHRSSDTATVQVVPPPPVASFTFSLNYYYYNDVTFDASNSQADPSTSISDYNWDFGDGNVYSSSYPQVDHPYDNVGAYTVTLTVDDATGQRSDAYTATVVISNS